MTAHHTGIDAKNPRLWGEFTPALIDSKPSANGERRWSIRDKNNVLMEGLPDHCDVGSKWLQSNSRVFPDGQIDVPVKFANGAPLAAVRWDLPGILVGLGFNIE